MSDRGPANVVIIMVDQLAASWLPPYGHDLVHAPNLTAMAAEGITFESAYCPSPLCAPSRASMLTGRRVSRIGVFDNASELPASVPTIAHHLRAAGYHTCLAGKMHFVGPDQLHGFEQRLTTDVYPASLDWTPDWTRCVADRLPWYHTMESVLTPARTVASMQTDYDDEVAFQAVRHVHNLARERPQRPFLLVVSFSNPHDPWEIPSAYWEHYEATAIALPTVPLMPLDRVDPHSRRLREMAGIDEIELTDEQLRRARQGYYAAISYVDERIGAVLTALGQCGLAANTIVAFTADHGEFLGERGLWYKMSFLEPSARVPLIVRMPGWKGRRRVPEPVSLLDLAPTVVELACGRVALAAADMDGESLVETLARRTERTPVISEYHAEGVNAPGAMIREGPHKLIVCGEDPDLLYDLASDPLELTNLSDRPECAETVRRLRAALAERLDVTRIEQQVLASQRERHLVARALAEGETAAWDFQPRVDASMQYVRSKADLYELQRRARLDPR